MVPATLNERRIDAVVMGGSAGAVAALTRVLPVLPTTFVPVLVVVHVHPSAQGLLPDVFARQCAMRVREAGAFDPIVRGTIYFAPPDYHLLVEADRRCALSIEPPVRFSRPSIDVLFESAADAFGPHLVAIVLTGANDDGATGLAAIDRRGGIAWIQDPNDAAVAIMPLAACKAVPAARVLPVSKMGTELSRLVGVS